MGSEEPGLAECSRSGAAPAARFASERNAGVPVAAPGEFAPLALGPLSIWPPVVLAPMAGVTNYPFRSLCREFGAGLYVSEMITARGFVLGNRKTRMLASCGPDERPRSIQVYGSDPSDLRAMVERLVEEGADHVDLNLGCPVPKVTAHGGGSAIPLRPRLMARLVRAMVGAARGVPVSVKVRKGIDDSLPTYLEAGRVAELEGASAIGLHARTAAQLYSGSADWQAIGELKASVSIPVLGNGDVWECWDALRMLRASGCDGVIVGRGCLGRPWLFRELAQVFDGREPDPPPALGEVAAILLDHARRLAAFFGEEVGMMHARKWVGWYTKGFRGSASVRAELHRLSTLRDLEGLIAELDPSEPFPITALRAGRAKGGRTQRVALPEGWLERRDDDAAPASPTCAAELAALERALQAG
jgi:nifR3 family TIM-barrel protein